MTASPTALATLPAAQQQFVLWGLAALRDAPPQAAGASGLRFDIAPTGIPYAHVAGRRVEVAKSDRGLLHWIVEQLQTRGAIWHASPRDDDVSLETLAVTLIAAYEFPDGDVELKPSAIELRPVLRLTFLRQREGEDALRELFLWNDGEELDEVLVRSLRLDDVVPLAEPPSVLDEQRVRRWVDTSLVRERRNYEADELGQFVAATLLWCRHVTGKMVFSADDSQIEVPLAGWARPLAIGDELPPPYACPLTGISSRRLSQTSDGRIVPREALGGCEQSGRRVLLAELDRCRETGKRVERDLLVHCLASGKLVLRDVLQTCTQCNQRVAPSALQSGRCSACRALAPVRSDDPRMARVLGEYPKLDRWSRWQLAETESTYLLTTKSLVRQVLLVVEKETLTVLYAAVAGRIWSPWQEMSQLQRDDLLG